MRPLCALACMRFVRARRTPLRLSESRLAPRGIRRAWRAQPDGRVKARRLDRVAVRRVPIARVATLLQQRAGPTWPRPLVVPWPREEQSSLRGSVGRHGGAERATTASVLPRAEGPVRAQGVCQGEWLA